MRRMIWIFLFCGGTGLGCGTAVRSYQSPGVSTYRHSGQQTVILKIVGMSGAFGISAVSGVSSRGTSAVALGMAQSYDGGKHGHVIAREVEFELQRAGFTLTRDQTKASLVAEFSIGTVRFDPLAGWIADQAYLVLLDKDSGETIVSYQASTRFITPTVKNIIASLFRKVHADFGL